MSACLLATAVKIRQWKSSHIYPKYIKIISYYRIFLTLMITFMKYLNKLVLNLRRHTKMKTKLPHRSDYFCISSKCKCLLENILFIDEQVKKWDQLVNLKVGHSLL